MTEGRECVVAFFYHKFKVMLAVLVVEDEVFLATDTEPIEKLKTCFH
jgi:hypothetical protein